MHQILGFGVIVILLIVYYAGLADVFDRRGGDDEKPMTTAFIWLLVFGIQTAFTYAQYALYAAGQLAGRAGGDSA